MIEKARSGRDAFAFSLKGMTTIASFTIAPAVADDCLNRAWSEKLGKPRTDGRGLTRRIEDALARYFAPGCCQAA